LRPDRRESPETLVRGALLAARNVAKAALLYGGLAGGLFALGWWLGGLRLGSVFLVVGLLMAATVYWYGPRVILASLGARELQLAEAPGLHSAAERLAMAARVDRPKLYILPDGHPRALSVGRGAGASGIAVTQGLVGLLSPAELEGVLAHELAHARHRDLLVQTPVVLVAGWLVEASRIGGFLERALLFMLGPVAASVVQVLLSPKRELAADVRAAEICGSPHPLADALVRIEQAMELVRFQASPVTEPLYVVNPFEPVGLAAMFSTHPAVGERVQRLRALDPDWREKLRAA
jgi:heat shock protein HtpX